MRHYRFGKREGFLVVSLMLTAVYLFYITNASGVSEWMENFWMWIQDLSVNHGYLGTFLSSILANASIIIPVPYTAVVLIVSAAGLNPIALGLISGIGAGIGEVTSYIAGLIGYKIGRKRFAEGAANLKRLIVERPKFTFWFLFLVGATPIPDDIFMIPLGLIRYNIFRAMIPFMLGKIVITTSIALIGYFLHETSSLAITDSNGIWMQGATLFGTFFMLYAIMKIDWMEYGKRLTSIKEHRQMKKSVKKSSA